MTVADLIELLKCCNQEAQVWTLFRHGAAPGPVTQVISSNHGGIATGATGGHIVQILGQREQ